MRVAVIAAAVAVMAGPAGAYQCKTSPTQATATHAVKITAQGQSKKNWSAIVKSNLGLSWSVWTIAAGRSVTCNKLASGKWTCLASAKPCNYVVP
jgi:hypothetical protein